MARRKARERYAQQSLASQRRTRSRLSFQSQTIQEMGANRKTGFSMKITYVVIVGLIYFFSALTLLAGESTAEFRIAIVAIDDSGSPVPAADIGLAWGRIGGEKPETDNLRKVADGDG